MPPLDIRVLDRSHGARMLEINRACPIVADFTFCFERDPDFLAWPDAVFERYVYTGGFRGDDLRAYSMLAYCRGHTGWPGGEFFYAGDARVLQDERGHDFVRRASVVRTAEIPPTTRVGFCLVKQGNAPARQVVDGADIPGFRRSGTCRFEATSVLLLRLRGGPLRCRVRRATAADVPALAEVMQRAFRGRLFAPEVTAGELVADCRKLPRFAIDRYYLAFVGDEIVGALGAWDADAVRRTVVLGFSARGQMVRLGYRAARLVLRRAAPLPRPGEAFRAITTTRVAVPSGDPAILRDLLLAVHDDHLGRGYHMIHVGFAGDDPLRPAVGGLATQRFVSDITFFERSAAAPLSDDERAQPFVDLRWL